MGKLLSLDLRALQQEKNLIEATLYSSVINNGPSLLFPHDKGMQNDA